MKKFAISFAVIISALMSTTPAWADANLVFSNPAKAQTVNEAPPVVLLSFDKQVVKKGTTFKVLDVNSNPIQVGQPEIQGPVITQRVNIVNPGNYVVRANVVTEDGSETSVVYPFIYKLREPIAPPAVTTGLKELVGNLALIAGIFALVIGAITLIGRPALKKSS